MRVRLTLTLVPLLGLGAGCGDGPSAAAVTPVSQVLVTPATASIVVGATAMFSATPEDSLGEVLAGRSIVWASSDTASVSVSASGIATAKRAGRTTITATSEGKSSSGVVIVAPHVVIAVEGLPAGAPRGIVQLKSGATVLAAPEIAPGAPLEVNTLTPGAYTIAALIMPAQVNGTTFWYMPADTLATRELTVTTTTMATITFPYVLRSGALTATVSGLPAGQQPACRIEFPPPGLTGIVGSGIVVPSGQTQTVSVWGAGAGTVICDPLQLSDGRYAPVAPTQSVTVPASTTPVPVSIVYAKQ